MSIDHIRNDNEPILQGWEVLTISRLAGLTQVDAGTLPGSAVDTLRRTFKIIMSDDTYIFVFLNATFCSIVIVLSSIF